MARRPGYYRSPAERGLLDIGDCIQCFHILVLETGQAFRMAFQRSQMSKLGCRRTQEITKARRLNLGSHRQVPGGDRNSLIGYVLPLSSNAIMRTATISYHNSGANISTCLNEKSHLSFVMDIGPTSLHMRLSDLDNGIPSVLITPSSLGFACVPKDWVFLPP
jgi:hypothetical protein